MATRQFPQKKTVETENELLTDFIEKAPVAPSDSPPQPDQPIDILEFDADEDFSLHHIEPNTDVPFEFPQDNRRYPRYLVRWQALLLSPGSKSTILQTTTQDLSKGGASVLSERNILLQTRTQAIMQLTIPPIRVGEGNRVIEIPCYMVHVYLDSTYQQFRIGIEFSDMDHDTKVTLHDALAEHTPAQL